MNSKLEMLTMQPKNMRLGDQLVDKGLITEEQLNGALLRQKTSGLKLGEQIIEDGILTESQVFAFLESQLGISHVTLENYLVKDKALDFIDYDFAMKNKVIPIDLKNGRLMVAMADPMNYDLVDELALISGLRVQTFIASRSSIEFAIEEYLENPNESAIEELDFSGMTALDSDKALADSPIVRMVNNIIINGLKARASDIHIEPTSSDVRIRFRVDGDLREYRKHDKESHAPLVTRIKIMAEMNISEKRKPQDGRVETIIDNHMVDMRISALPTVYGEKIVIRLLDRSSIVIDKRKLGLTRRDLEMLEDLMKYPQGMILATGPTGSGKTTSLYSLLKELNSSKKNIITVEDPVEYRLKGINQVQVNKKAGLTFASGLRAILRQDPDIIMVGEIRDKETAQIAVRASITGHVVLSTLHTNDTASTITRLIDMGIERYIVATSVVGIISQRLVKQLCNSCKSPHITSESEMEILGLDQPIEIYQAEGCDACEGSGFSGRTAIYEIMVINKKIREMINAGRTVDDVKDYAIKNGLNTLKKSCKNLIINGKTTINELVRVTYSVE